MKFHYNQKVIKTNNTLDKIYKNTDIFYVFQIIIIII